MSSVRATVSTLQLPNQLPATSTVYIIEDDVDARAMLVALLESSGGRVHGFATAEDFLRHGASERPACALVDVDLPGMSGLELQAKLPGDTPQLPVIVFTGRGDAATARAALLAGALDFLEKPVRPQELLDAVGAALASDAQAIERARELQQIAEMVKRLTPREHEVFQHITDGLLNREIALKLGISPRTVEIHRERLMYKLKARRLADLFRIRLATEPADPEGAHK